MITVALLFAQVLNVEWLFGFVGVHVGDGGDEAFLDLTLLQLGLVDHVAEIIRGVHILDD